MPSPLQRYLDSAIRERGWSIPQFAEKAGLSTSTAYLIVRDGKANVQQKTFEQIAASLSLTPAELAVAINPPPTGDVDPDLAEVIDLYRTVPLGQRSTAKALLRALGMAAHTTPANRHHRPRANRPGGTTLEMERDGRTRPDQANNDPLTLGLQGLTTAFRILARHPLSLATG